MLLVAKSEDCDITQFRLIINKHSVSASIYNTYSRHWLYILIYFSIFGLTTRQYEHINHIWDSNICCHKLQT